MRGAPTRATSSNGLTLAALLEALKSVDTFLPRRPPRARLIVSASLSDGQIYRLEAPASFRFDADDTGIRWAMNQATFDHIRGDLRLGGHDFADALESGYAAEQLAPSAAKSETVFDRFLRDYQGQIFKVRGGIDATFS